MYFLGVDGGVRSPLMIWRPKAACSKTDADVLRRFPTVTNAPPTHPMQDIKNVNELGLPKSPSHPTAKREVPSANVVFIRSAMKLNPRDRPTAEQLPDDGCPPNSRTQENPCPRNVEKMQRRDKRMRPAAEPRASELADLAQCLARYGAGRRSTLVPWITS
jgi:hypothetical protein